jgi:hypothetical protein
LLLALALVSTVAPMLDAEITRIEMRVEGMT